MSWLDDIQKDLQDAKQHPSREKKDWEIDRDIRLKDQSKKAAKKRVETLTKEQCSNGGKVRAANGGIEQIMKASSFESRSKGGVTSGNNNVKSGHWKKVQEAALEVVTQEVKCPHCSEVGNLNIMKRWHFDKCKWQGFDFSVVHTMSKDGISQYQIARELGITRDNVRDILSGKKK